MDRVLPSHFAGRQFSLLRNSRLAAVLLTTAAFSCERPPEMEKPRRWAYVLPESFTADFEARVESYDTLCIAVYRLNAAGTLYIEPALRQTDWNRLDTLRTGRRVFALVSLSNAYDGEVMLRSQALRKRAVQELSKLVKRRRLDGLHIDFEFLRSRSKHDFAAFLRELGGKENGVISIAAFPPFHGQPEEIDFFDPSVVGPAADEIVYMTYDYHYPRSKPGPVTDLRWAEQNIREAMKFIPARRIWMGVPLYGYHWRGQKPGVPISAQTGATLLKLCGGERADSGTVEVRCPDSHASYSDSETIRRMEELAAALQLRGTAHWRIGFEGAPANAGSSTSARPGHGR